MPCIGLSPLPATYSTRKFRGSRPWEAFRGLEEALALVLEGSEIAPD